MIINFAYIIFSYCLIIELNDEEKLDWKDWLIAVFSPFTIAVILGVEIGRIVKNNTNKNHDVN